MSKLNMNRRPFCPCEQMQDALMSMVNCGIRSCETEAYLPDMLIEPAEKALRTVLQTIIDGIVEDLPEEDIAVLLLDETGDDSVIGRREAELLYDEYFEFDTEDVEDDFELLIAYDSSRLLELGGIMYLMDCPILLLELDDNGNPCHVDAQTVMQSRKFLKHNLVKVKVDGKDYSAYRLSV